MNWNFIKPASLKIRVTLATLGIFLIILWSLSYYASKVLREDMQSLLSRQQESTVSYVAAEINRGLQERIKALMVTANAIDSRLLNNHSVLQKFIENRIVLHDQFNGGVFAVSLDGTVIADVPLATGRIGINLMERGVIAAALKEGKSTIGQPVIGKMLASPIFHVATPIRDSQGKVIGALAGAINLGLPNFLDQIQANHYGNTGGYMVLVSPQQRMIIAASDRYRPMDALPAPGVNPMIDRFIQGFEGSSIHINPTGVEVLGSFKRIPVAGWYVAALLPTETAFAPIYDTQRRMLLATLLLTLLAGVLIWWVMKRQLSPMLIAARALSHISDSDQFLEPLPISKQDEIGQLIGGFNRLIQTLKNKDIALHKSEELYRAAFQTSLDSININRLVDGLYLEVNQSFLDLMGYTRAEIIGHTSIELGIWNKSDDRQHLIEELQRNGKYQNLEAHFKKKNGELIWGLMSARIIELDGVPCLLSITRDITDRKLAAVALEKSYKELLKSEEKLIEVQTIANLGTYTYDLRSDTWTSTAILDDICGLGSDYPRNYQGWLALIAPEFCHEIQAYMEDHSENKKPFNSEFQIIRANDGQHRWVHGIASLTYNEAGSPLFLTGTVQDITERKSYSLELQRIAYYDTLTNLPNRVLLADRLNLAMAQARRRGQQLAVVYLDLDDFKPINDCHGHEVGDQMLVELSNRMKHVLREGDTLARLGGDEFIAVLLDVPDIEASVPVLNRLLAAACQPTQIRDVVLEVSASVGVTFYPQTEDMDADQLLRQADNAMYQAKQAGKNRYHLFDAEQDRSVRSHHEGLGRIRQAMTEEEFVLHYQPKVDMASGEVIGVEALIRWMHPEQGLLSPGTFLHYLEGSELEIAFGEWVIDAALIQMETWDAVGLSLSISVNISADHLLQADFADRLHLALSRHPSVDPACLELEILETAAMSDMSQAVNALTRCHEQGVRISLDDFGTGYSSLTYLRTLPVDILKIDQSFIRDMLTDPSDLGIVVSVIQLAQTFNRVVIAEGVETLEHGAMLVHLGCSLMQGYGIARPMPADQVPGWIDQWRAKEAWRNLTSSIAV